MYFIIAMILVHFTLLQKSLLLLLTELMKGSTDSTLNGCDIGETIHQCYHELLLACATTSRQNL